MNTTREKLGQPSNLSEACTRKYSYDYRLKKIVLCIGLNSRVPLTKNIKQLSG